MSDLPPTRVAAARNVKRELGLDLDPRRFSVVNTYSMVRSHFASLTWRPGKGFGAQLKKCVAVTGLAVSSASSNRPWHGRREHSARIEIDGGRRGSWRGARSEGVHRGPLRAPRRSPRGGFSSLPQAGKGGH